MVVDSIDDYFISGDISIGGPYRNSFPEQSEWRGRHVRKFSEEITGASEVYSTCISSHVPSFIPPPINVADFRVHNHQFMQIPPPPIMRHVPPPPPPNLSTFSGTSFKLPEMPPPVFTHQSSTPFKGAQIPPSVSAPPPVTPVVTFQKPIINESLLATPTLPVPSMIDSLTKDLTKGIDPNTLKIPQQLPVVPLEVPTSIASQVVPKEVLPEKAPIAFLNTSQPASLSGITNAEHPTLAFSAHQERSASSKAPQGNAGELKVPIALADKPMSMMQEIGRAASHIAGNFLHEVWDVAGGFGAAVTSGIDLVSNKILNGSVNYEQNAHITNERIHAKIDEVFGDSRFLLRPDAVLLQVPTPGGASTLAGRVAQVVALEGNAARTSSIASRAIIELEQGKRIAQISQIEKQISLWVGEDAKFILNEAGDSIFLSKDGLRCVRFDFNQTKPHNNPHAHMEIKVDGKWVKSGPIYPADVPHN